MTPTHARLLKKQKVLKSSVGRKSEDWPNLKETVDKNTNHEFPDKIVAIKLLNYLGKSETQRQIIFTVKRIRVL